MEETKGRPLDVIDEEMSAINSESDFGLRTPMLEKLRTNVPREAEDVRLVQVSEDLFDKVRTKSLSMGPQSKPISGSDFHHHRLGPERVLTVAESL